MYSQYGEDTFVILLGGPLHKEMAWYTALGMQEGSGWVEALQGAELTTQDWNCRPFLKASHVTQTQHAQSSNCMCTVYSSQKYI